MQTSVRERWQQHYPNNQKQENTYYVEYKTDDGKSFECKVNEDVFNNNKIYLIQNGTYSSYENMRAKTIGYDYVFYEDELGYNSIVAVTKNKKNIEKIIKLYNINADVIEYYLNNNEINKKIDEYDKELEKENDQNKQKEIIKLMLEIYKNNKVTLSKSY